MPKFTDIVSIGLDKFQMQKNPTPKQDPTNNQFFLYFDFPPQGYPIKFNPMLYDSTGKPYNILNYAVTSTVNDKPFPMLYLAANGKFKLADVQTYIPIGIQITQKIHNSNVMGTSTNNDLQMIMECNQVDGSKIVFIHILLTVDTQNKNNGDDFNKFFDNLSYIDQIETNTKNFETQNSKASAIKYNFSSGISNQFSSSEAGGGETEGGGGGGEAGTEGFGGGGGGGGKSIKCFYFSDTDKNTHVILQAPIPISSNNFTKVQHFYENVGLATNPFKVYSNTNLTPDKSLPIINDVLLGNMDALKDAQTTPPETVEGQKKTELKQKKAGQKDKAVETAKKGEKNASEGFIGSFFKTNEKEGLKTMNCRVSQSSDKLIATLVGGDDKTVSLDGYHLIIALGSIIIIIMSVIYIIRMRLPTAETIEKLYSIRLLHEKFMSMNIWINQGIPGFLLFAAIMLCIPLMIPKLSSSVVFPCTLIAIICIVIMLTIRCSVALLNQRISPNRYGLAYKLINSNIFKKYKLDQVKTDGNIDRDYTETKTAINQQYIVFLNQCMSHYFGDGFWYEDKSIKKEVNQINKIQYQTDNDGKEIKEVIEVLIHGQKPYIYSGKEDQQLVIPPTSGN
jgi:hypothetical protein